MFDEEYLLLTVVQGPYSLSGSCAISCVADAACSYQSSLYLRTSDGSSSYSPSIICSSYGMSSILLSNESCRTQFESFYTFADPLTLTVAEGLTGDVLSQSAAKVVSGYLSQLQVGSCSANVQLVTPSAVQIPTKLTASATPQGSISIGTPSVTASTLLPPIGTGVNTRDNTVKIVNKVVVPVVCVAGVFVSGIILFVRRRMKLRRREKKLERSGEAEAPPFLQMKPELDAVQQRHELDATPKEPRELEGQSSRQEMMTQADKENRVTRHVQELRAQQSSHELDGKCVQSE
ncbi:MAG: hypothetical protein Q9202_002416 [Teloschistes flavicans]